MFNSNVSVTKNSRFISIFRFALFLFLCFSVTEVNAAQKYTSDGVNLRSEASADSKILNTIPAQTAITVTAVSGNWSKVNYENQSGYIYSSLLSSDPSSSSSQKKQDAANKNKTTAKKKVVSSTINADSVNLRKKVNDSSKVKEVLNTGDTVSILSKEGNWTKVSTASGKHGYVFSEYIGAKKTSSPKKKKVPKKKDDINQYRSDAISIAEKRIGDKYSQTKRNLKGFADCSSLVRDAFGDATTVYIGDNTTSQIDVMKEDVYKISSLSEVSAGDLVYHLTDSNHTGIYLGDNKVLHASFTKGEVAISEFDPSSTYWEYGCNAAAYCYSQLH